MAKSNTKNIDRPKASSLKPLRMAIPFMRPYLTRLLLAFLFLTLASISMLAMPIAIRYVIDYGFSSDNLASINTYFISLLFSLPCLPQFDITW